MDALPLRFSLAARVRSVLQTEASECSIACLVMVASYFGYRTDLTEMRKRFPVSLRGATLAQIIGMAEQMGLTTRPLRLEVEEITELRLPAILHWRMNHFVVATAANEKFVWICDPATGEMRVPLSEVSAAFTGVALELSPGATFRRKSAPPAVRLRNLVGRVVGLKRALTQLLFVAMALEVLALTPPVLTQWITDEAIGQGDQPLLGILAAGVVAIGTFSALIGAVRSWMSLYISTTFNLQWMSNVMGHLLRLPVSYFDKRHLGDIVSRFGAVHSIEQNLTNNSVEIFMDVLIGFGMGTMMFIYSPLMAGLSVGVALTYAGLRWARYGAVRFASVSQIARQAREQSYFLETVRGARCIKLFGKESERKTVWLNLWTESTNAGLILQRLTIAFSTIWSVLSTAERGGVLWLGASSVIDHRLSLGMLFAFLSYKEQFSARMSQLVDRVVELKMVGLYADRLSDIVGSAPEESFALRRQDVPERLDLVLEDVTYAYGPDDEPLLDKVNLSISCGESVAIIGPSGCGKSTCLKIMLGILNPGQGKVKVGGLSLQQIGLAQYRRKIAAVMQDDQLFAGSVLDNICFLEEKPDEDWMIVCAKTASIHEEISSMTMGYHTLIGDMGTVISGGQKQRILLARALYRRPQILFMDEATSHLDLASEAKIATAIAELRITRVIIAHRPQTIRSADRILMFSRGKLEDQTSQWQREHDPAPAGELLLLDVGERVAANG
jgi:ATP-binding cassette subfamily B protein RaxB